MKYRAKNYSIMIAITNCLGANYVVYRKMFPDHFRNVYTAALKVSLIVGLKY